MNGTNFLFDLIENKVCAKGGIIVIATMMDAIKANVFFPLTRSQKKFYEVKECQVKTFIRLYRVSSERKKCNALNANVLGRQFTTAW